MKFVDKRRVVYGGKIEICGMNQDRPIAALLIILG